MLILSRRIGERIFIIGPEMEKIEVCITVRKSTSGQVSLGIDAGKKYTILREEVFLRDAERNINEHNEHYNSDPASYRNDEIEWDDERDAV